MTCPCLQFMFNVWLCVHYKFSYYYYYIINSLDLSPILFTPPTWTRQDSLALSVSAVWSISRLRLNGQVRTTLCLWRRNKHLSFICPCNCSLCCWRQAMLSVLSLANQRNVVRRGCKMVSSSTCNLCWLVSLTVAVSSSSSAAAAAAAVGPIIR